MSTARLASLIGDFARARSWLDEAASLFDELADPEGEAFVLDARCWLEVRSGNYDEVFELAERLATLSQSFDDDDAASAAAKARMSSEAEASLAWALLGRAVEDNDRKAAERSREIFGARADAAATTGTLMEQAAWLSDLATNLFVLETYPESIATAQRALRKILEIEAANQTQLGPMWDCLFTIGLSLCGRGDTECGIRLVSATRQMWRIAGVGVTDEPLGQAIYGRVEKSARKALGDDGYQAAVNAGEALTREQAIALGLSITPR